MVGWIYGIGISASLTLALVWMLKAVLRVTERQVSSRERTAHVQALLDERDRALLNLRELDFDHALRKISNADREALRIELRGDLRRTLEELESLGVDPDTPSETGAGAPA